MTSTSRGLDPDATRSQPEHGPKPRGRLRLNYGGGDPAAPDKPASRD